MFFRTKSSGPRTYLQVVENRWQDGRSRQRVVATLGRLDQLRHSGRLIRAVQLDRVPHGQVNSGVVDLGGVDKLRSDPDPAPCRNRREEPHPIEPIVDAHLGVLDAVVGLAQTGNQ